MPHMGGADIDSDTDADADAEKDHKISTCGAPLYGASQSHAFYAWAITFFTKRGSWNLWQICGKTADGKRSRTVTGRDRERNRKLKKVRYLLDFVELLLDTANAGTYHLLAIAGWSSLVARWAHNPKVAGSNPAPATKHSYPNHNHK
jgi:hypothetical protein